MPASRGQNLGKATFKQTKSFTCSMCFSICCIFSRCDLQDIGDHVPTLISGCSYWEDENIVGHKYMLGRVLKILVFFFCSSFSYQQMPASTPKSTVFFLKNCHFCGCGKLAILFTIRERGAGPGASRAYRTGLDGRTPDLKLPNRKL